MSLKLLTLKTLADLGDGDLERNFEAVLAAAVKDCTARPSLKNPRKVTLQIVVRPVLKQDGTCDDVTVDVEVGSKSPAKIVPTYTMTTTANGGLRYNPQSPNDPNQQTLYPEE